MPNCNAFSVASYVLLLERLRKEGYFENFSKEDIDSLVDKSIGYFERFKENAQRYDALNSKNPTTRSVNVVSKHHFSFMDYNEKIGDRIIDVQNSSAQVRTKYDVFCEGKDFIYPVEARNKTVAVDMDFNRMGVKLNYNAEDEIYCTYGNIDTSIHFLKIDFSSIVTKKMLDNGLTENPLYFSPSHPLMTAFREYSEKISNLDMVHKNALISTFEDFALNKFQHLYLSQMESTPIPSDMISVRNAPISINGDDLLGSFISKDKMALHIKNLITKVILSFVQDSFNRIVGNKNDNPLPNIAITDFEAIMYPVINDLAAALISYVQANRENSIMKSFLMLQTGNMNNLIGELNRYFGNENHNALERHSKSKDGLKFSIDTIAVKKSILTIPVYEKNSVVFSEINFAIEELSETLDRIKHTLVTPKNIKFEVDARKKTSIIEVIDFVEEGVRLAVTCNDTMNQYLISKDFSKSGFFKSITLDESDKRAGGKLAKTFRAIAEQADNIIASSGTPTAGTAKDIVPQLALSGNMDSANVLINEIEYTKQCGVFEIKSTVLAAAAFGVTTEHKEFSEYFYTLYKDFLNIISGDSESVDLRDFLMKSVLSVVANLMKYGLANEDTFNNIEFEKTEVPALKTLFLSMSKTDKDTSGVLNFSSLVEYGLSNARTLTKLIPGINNPKTFVGLIESTEAKNTSIMARETLSGKKEKLIIEDIAWHKENFPKDTNSSQYSAEKFYNGNRTGVRIAQSAIAEFAFDNYLYSIIDYLTQNFKLFMDNFQNKKGEKGIALKHLSEYLNTKYDNVFTPSSLSTLFEQSTTSATDNFESIYKDYLLLNGNLEDAAKYRNIDALKLSVFYNVLEIFDKFIKGLKKHDTNNKDEKFIIQLNSDIDIDFSSSNFYAVDSFTSMRGTYSVGELLSDLKDGYPQSLIFSSVVDLCPYEYRYLFKDKTDDGYYLPYRINFTIEQENEVLDSVASLGIENQIYAKTCEGKGLVISSARTTATMINFLTTLDSAIRYTSENPQSKNIALILNVPNTKSGEGMRYRDIASRLDPEIINNGKVTIHPIPRSSLDSTVKSSLEKGFQALVVTNYESASRGLDLSGLDEIIATGAMNKGKEMIQFLSRLFSVNRQHATISMFHGGEDAQLSPLDKEEKGKLIDYVFQPIHNNLTPKEREKLVGMQLDSLFGVPSRGTLGATSSRELIKLCPASFIYKETQTAKNSLFSIDKLMVFKAFMLGENTSIDSVIGKQQSHKPKAFVAAKGYANKIQLLMEKKENIVLSGQSIRASY